MTATEIHNERRRMILLALSKNVRWTWGGRDFVKLALYACMRTASTSSTRAATAPSSRTGRSRAAGNNCFIPESSCASRTGASCSAITHGNDSLPPPSKNGSIGLLVDSLKDEAHSRSQTDLERGRREAPFRASYRTQRRLPRASS